MATRKLLSVSGITATQTSYSDVRGCAAKPQANYYAEVTTAASTNSTWTVTLNTLSPAGTAIKVASGTVAVQTAGVTLLTAHTNFTTGTEPCPVPEQIVFTEGTDGSSLTGDVFMIWSD